MENSGLINRAMSAEAPQGANAPQETAGNVSPEEQAEYETYIIQAEKIVYDEEVAAELLGLLDSTGNVEEGVANMAFFALTALDERNGNVIPEDMLLSILEEMVDMVIELVEAKLKTEVTVEQAEKALQVSVLRLMEEHNIDEADLQEAFDDMSPEQIKALVNETSGRFGGSQVLEG